MSVGLWVYLDWLPRFASNWTHRGRAAARTAQSSMQVLPETLHPRPSPGQPGKSRAGRRANQWSYRIFHRRLSWPLACSMRALPHCAVRAAPRCSRPFEPKGESMSTARIPLAVRRGRHSRPRSDPISRPRKADDTIKIGILHSLVGHDGDQRNDPEGSDVDGGRRRQCQRRASRQEDRAGGGRPRLELAAVCGEGPRTADKGQGCRRVRLLDLGVPQVGTAGVRGAERTAVLPARI